MGKATTSGGTEEPARRWSALGKEFVGKNLCGLSVLIEEGTLEVSRVRGLPWKWNS